jgi:hypothetical protein
MLLYKLFNWIFCTLLKCLFRDLWPTCTVTVLQIYCIYISSGRHLLTSIIWTLHFNNILCKRRWTVRFEVQSVPVSLSCQWPRYITGTNFLTLRIKLLIPSAERSLTTEPSMFRQN